tara:strand:+ start:1181 stop:1444 length:264 start_codon:yes stop_codon:yes gene_type:complete
MSDPLIRSCDYYVVLEPGKEEKILDVKATISWLKLWLEKMKELNTYKNMNFDSNISAEDLIESTCELSVGPGFIIKWYAVRIEPNHY